MPLRARLARSVNAEVCRPGARKKNSAFAGFALRCAAMLVLSVARLVHAAQREELRNRRKGSLAAVQAAHRQAHEKQLRQIRRPKPKTRGAKLQKAANAAIDCHTSLQLSQIKGKDCKVNKNALTWRFLSIGWMEQTHRSRDARASHFCIRGRGKLQVKEPLAELPSVCGYASGLDFSRALTPHSDSRSSCCQTVKYLKTNRCRG
jgi:hypothetical protein